MGDIVLELLDEDPATDHSRWCLTWMETLPGQKGRWFGVVYLDGGPLWQDGVRAALEYAASEGHIVSHNDMEYLGLVE